MKAMLCQINTTPGDFAGNYKKIFNNLLAARGEDVDVIIFPELCIPGYLCRDLMYEKGFTDRNLFILQEIVRDSNLNDQYIVVGYIGANRTGIGKPFTNMLAVIHKGLVVGTYQKRLLPFYDVFDEGRYFEPGKESLVMEIDKEKVGFAICEDLWHSCKGETDLYNYETNPVTLYKKLGVDTIISINSSPFTKGKPEYRLEMLKDIASKNDIKIVYVNQVGGQDDLVFDGHSCVVGKADCVLGFMGSEEKHEIISTRDIALSHSSSYSIQDKTKNVYDMLVMGIRDYVNKTGFSQIVLGSSGGIDSALVATLACDAIGNKNVTCIMMPSCYSSEGSVKDAQKLHQHLQCDELESPIPDHIAMIDVFRRNLHLNINGLKTNPVADENIQSRLRGLTIMYYANSIGALALGTSNKCESAVGYYTVFGDTANFFNPLIDLYKMEIYDLANWINKTRGTDLIPKEIINKAPSAELAPGQTDENSLLPYPVLDKIVCLYVEQYVNDFESFCAKSLSTPCSKEDYDRIIRLIRTTEFKRRMVALGIKLTKRSFGSGRRYPVVCKY
jgi:NAD+ synthetase